MGLPIISILLIPTVAGFRIEKDKPERGDTEKAPSPPKGPPQSLELREKPDLILPSPCCLLHQPAGTSKPNDQRSRSELTNDLSLAPGR